MDSELNYFAQEMLQKACQHKNGLIICGKDQSGNDYIKINEELYLTRTNWEIFEAFEQLVNYGFATKEFSVYESQYKITDKGYSKVDELVDNQNTIIM